MKKNQLIKNEFPGIHDMVNVFEQVYQKLEESEDLDKKHLNAVMEYMKALSDKYRQPGLSGCISTTTDQLLH